MKAEINNENKSKFFALYWGQKVFRNLHHGIETHVNNSNQSSLLFGSAVWLELKPLSSISDEDAIEVARMVSGKNPFRVVRNSNRIIIHCSDSINIHEKHIVSIWIDSGNVSYIFKKGDDWMACHQWNQIQWTDYLRSRSYLLPWMGLSCEEIIEAGWAKYETI